jgi:hypothetical protein
MYDPLEAQCVPSLGFALAQKFQLIEKKRFLQRMDAMNGADLSVSEAAAGRFWRPSAPLWFARTILLRMLVRRPQALGYNPGPQPSNRHWKTLS